LAVDGGELLGSCIGSIIPGVIGGGIGPEQAGCFGEEVSVLPPSYCTANPRITRLICSEKSLRNMKTRKVNN